MTMQDYEQAGEIVSKHPTLNFFVGSRTENLIKVAEEKLGLKFPPTYRRFLIEYGAGGFGSSEIFGVIHENFDTSSSPDVVWTTFQQRKYFSFPKNLIVIYSVGDGEIFCLDIGNTNTGEIPVVTYQPGYLPEEQRKEVIAQDFGRFFLDLVQSEVKLNSRRNKEFS